MCHARRRHAPARDVVLQWRQSLGRPWREPCRRPWPASRGRNRGAGQAPAAPGQQAAPRSAQLRARPPAAGPRLPIKAAGSRQPAAPASQLQPASPAQLQLSSSWQASRLAGAAKRRLALAVRHRRRVDDGLHRLQLLRAGGKRERAARSTQSAPGSCCSGGAFPNSKKGKRPTVFARHCRTAAPCRTRKQ